MAKNPISPSSEPVRFAGVVVAAAAAVLTQVAPDIAFQVEAVVAFLAVKWARARVSPVE